MTVQGPVKKQIPDGMSHGGGEACIRTAVHRRRRGGTPPWTPLPPPLDPPPPPPF